MAQFRTELDPHLAEPPVETPSAAVEPAPAEPEHSISARTRGSGAYIDADEPPAALGALALAGAVAATAAGLISYFVYATRVPIVAPEAIALPPGYGLPRQYFWVLFLITALAAVLLLVWNHPARARSLWYSIVTVALAVSTVVGGAGALWFSRRSGQGLTEPAAAYLALETLLTSAVALCGAVAVILAIRVGNSWSWPRPALLYVPGAIAVGVSLVAALYLQSAWMVTPPITPAPDQEAVARAAYAQALNDWFKNVNRLAGPLEKCPDPVCRHATLTDFLDSLGKFDHAVRRLQVPSQYMNDWLALERADTIFEVQLLQAFQSSDGLGNLSSSADEYTGAADLARDLDIPGY